MSKIQESIVLVGGGGGVYRVARHLKHIRPNITTIQTSFDHGGHSGELRDERGVLPPGDIRQAILALSDDSMQPEFRALLAYRFSKKNGSALDDTTVGNVILTALTEINGGLHIAIDILCRWFGVRGKVLPVSLDHADLCVELSDGTRLVGEGKIDTRSVDDDRMIVKAHLEPKAHIFERAYEALTKADKIVFCPGDLYTSIIPNTLVDGFQEAMKESGAKVIYALNLMTKKAETHKYKASKFAETLLSYIGKGKFDAVICNNAKITSALLAKYRKEHSHPVKVDMERLEKFTRNIVMDDLVDDTGGILRHREKIASIIADL